MLHPNKMALIGICFFVSMQGIAQRFNLFAPEIKTEYPSVVYDFLERYLYEIDSLQTNGGPVDLRLRDDKVLFLTGNASTARHITPDMPFSVASTAAKFYEVSWVDSLGTCVLDVAFPMQYELILGKSKVELEQVFKEVLSEPRNYTPLLKDKDRLLLQTDSCLMTQPICHYYVESLNTATYYRRDANDSLYVVFSPNDKWHSAANLFQGCVDSISDYILYVEQNLYGFKKKQYTIPLSLWLAYCQAMKFQVYFAIEEEREDGLKALLIAQSTDLGFNHMFSLIIPDDFVEHRNSVVKGSLHAYIPTQNVKDLYKQYVENPKKKI